MLEIGEEIDRVATTQKRATLLGYAGLLPFALGALAVWFPATLGRDFVFNFTYVILLYGAVILSFMGGARWGAAITAARPSALAGAIVPALVGWLSVVPGRMFPLVNPTDSMRFFILMTAFVLLLMTEVQSREWARWYTGLRLRLSLMTAGLLFLMILGLNY